MARLTTTLGSLSCQVVQETSGKDSPDLAVVLCHGFGATGDDLVSLGPELSRRRPELRRARFVFPAGPLPLAPLGFGGGRAWWMIDLARLQGDAAAARTIRRETPEGLPAARRMLMALVDELCRQTGLPASRVLLGGFSQGAMLATDVALRLEDAPAGLAIMSGTLLCQDEWEKRAARRKGLPVLQSHGRLDPLLPFEAAEALRDLLESAGLDVQFVPFDDGHTIALPAFEQLGEFISKAARGLTSPAGAWRDPPRPGR